MNICPRIEADINKIRHNTRYLTNLCKKLNISVAGVTKAFCAHKEIAQAMVEGGIEMVADSRIENLKRLEALSVPKLLLRLPMRSQVQDVVRYADISLNSELSTIQDLGAESLCQNKIHRIILMIDLGDLREGIWKDDILDKVGDVLKTKGIQLAGIGTNLTCYGGVLPSRDNLGILAKIASTIEEVYGITLEVISGGNSSSLYILERGEIPTKINHLRLGESILLGRETAYGNNIENVYQDAFTFIAEIIELKEKPSVPIGEVGMDAFGNKPVFTDKGVRKRAILSVGRQDVSIENLFPLDKRMSILGASSDHLIMDVTDCDHEYAVGDEVRFGVDYGSLLALMTSPYIHKKFK